MFTGKRRLLKCVVVCWILPNRLVALYDLQVTKSSEEVAEGAEGVQSAASLGWEGQITRGYLAFGTVRLVGTLVTCAFVAIERRHLMVCQAKII
jgi:hypothetical protein